MRHGMVALVVALALAISPTPAPAVTSGPLSIHVEAGLEEPTSVGARAVFLLNGMAILTGPVDVVLTVIGPFILLEPFSPSAPNINSSYDFSLEGGRLSDPVHVRCTGKVDDAGTGSGRCASTGQFDGRGTWAGRTDTQAHSLTLTIYLLVVCPHCVPR